MRRRRSIIVPLCVLTLAALSQAAPAGQPAPSHATAGPVPASGVTVRRVAAPTAEPDVAGTVPAGVREPLAAADASGEVSEEADNAQQAASPEGLARRASTLRRPDAQMRALRETASLRSPSASRDRRDAKPSSAPIRRAYQTSAGTRMPELDAATTPRREPAGPEDSGDVKVWRDPAPMPFMSTKSQSKPAKPAANSKQGKSVTGTKAGPKRR